MLKRILGGKGEVDWGIIFVVLMLALIGLASIYVAVVHDNSTGADPVHMIVMQGIWYALGICAVIFIMQFDSEKLWVISPYIFAVGVFLMVAVLIFYSRSYAIETGGKSWFALGPLTFQPSEVMKPAFVLMLARVITVHNLEYNEHTLQNDIILLRKITIWSLPIIILVLLQHDFGTMLVFLAIIFGMTLVSGMSWRILCPVIFIGTFIGGSAIALVASDMGRRILSKFGFQSYQFARIDAWLKPKGDTSNSAYQLWHSMTAIGSGGLTGTGFNVSHVNVPVRESDMIFSVIGENVGFVGSLIILLLYFLLIYRIFQVVMETSNQFYAYIGAGIIMMLIFHIFENIGMSIGIVPLTGIPLPFISQGGSALIGNMIGIGLIMSMSFHNKKYTLSEHDGFV